jgi:microsomal prostaglandin-E synthase 2
VYQYEVCPFCCKVKAFLDYHKLPYRVVEVNPLTKSELKWSQYKKVPVIVLDDSEQVNDSSAIISRLAAELAAQNKKTSVGLFSFGGKKKGGAASPEEEEKWRRWVDERLVRVITVNIYRTAKESFQTFEYISEAGNFGWVHREAARIAGATMMWAISNKLKKKYNVEGDLRENLYKCANDWVDAVGNDRPFFGGDVPNLADISVFGVMKSITGTDTFMDLQHKTRIGPWYERMFEAVGETSRLPDLK